MAIVLGKKMMIDTKEYEEYAIGITLPIQIFINITNKTIWILTNY